EISLTNLSPVARGGFADVWRGKRTSDGLDVALKGLRLNSEDAKLKKLLVREISIWSKLNHTNVLPFLGITSHRSLAVKHLLVSPWQSSGNVIKYLQTHEDADRSKIIRGVADGLKYLHSTGVVHGDLKGANILMASDGHPVLSDFGLSAIESRNSQTQSTTQTFAGTQRWMAPERLNPEHYGLSGRTSRTPASDMYSFGMTIYEIYSGRQPFHESNDLQALLAALSGRRPSHPGEDAVRRGLSASLWEFVSQCWSAEYASRP
ncbi:kinase-like protein, partial [Calocera cornea HHB12733]